MRLVHGSGSERGGACWMTALHFYTRRDDTWTDEAPWACTSRLVRGLAIMVNDACRSDAMREMLIGPHLFAPLGTNTGPEDERTRAMMAMDHIVRTLLPDWIKARLGNNEITYLFRHLKPVVDYASAHGARRSLEYVIKRCQNARQRSTNSGTFIVSPTNAVGVTLQYVLECVAFCESLFCGLGSTGHFKDGALVFGGVPDQVENKILACLYSMVTDPHDLRVFEFSHDGFTVSFQQRIVELRDLVLRTCEVGQRVEVTPTCTKERVLARLEA